MRLLLNDVHYEVNVIGEGDPLLLIHGFSGSQQQWKPFVQAWSKHYRLILVDMLGHGNSDVPDEVERYQMERVVTDLTALLEQLGMNKVHVLGYSMGGRIALSFAMLASNKVQSVILESSSPGLATEEERAARRAGDKQLAENIEQKGIEWFAQYWGSLPLFASLQKLPQATLDKLHAARLSNNPKGLAQSLRGIGTGQQPSWWEQLHQLSIPVLLIAGAEDQKYCAIAETMKKQLPNCELKLVPEAGHNVHMEQPQLFDTIVISFLDQKRMV